MLTYKVNNPSPWDIWYTKFDSSNPIENRQQTPADGYNNGPTYRLKDGLAGGLLGQQEYKESDVISKIVYDTYQGVVTSHPEVIPAEGQAFFEDAYVITNAVDVTVGTSTRHLNPGAVISATEKTSYGLSEANSSPAYISTRTIQLSATDYIYQGTKMSSTEKDGYITRLTTDIKAILPAAQDVTKISDLTEAQLSGLSADQKKTLAQLLTVREEIRYDITSAYYCKTAGLYGGDYYESGKNYRGLAVWSSMSKDDREKFTFNYDAFDLLIDPTYSGTVGKKYQYDSEAATPEGAQNNPAGYSLDKPVDYTATYNGSDDALKLGREYTRQEFEALANERRHYSGIVVNDKDATYYVVNTSFQIGNTPYAIGSTISSSVYETLGDTDKGYITKLKFTTEGTYYYCRENYTIGEKGDGMAVNWAADVTVDGQPQSGSYSVNDNVPLGVVIDATNYGNLVNKQVNFTIHGIAPTEVSTLYVSRNSDIFDLSKEKIRRLMHLVTSHLRVSAMW